MLNLTVKNGNITKTVKALPEKPLLETLRENGFSVAAFCGGRGICGKCKIKLPNGQESLACKSYISEDTVIEINTPGDNEFQILNTYRALDTPIPNSIQIVCADIKSMGGSLSEYIYTNFGGKELSLNMLRELSQTVSRINELETEQKNLFIVNDGGGMFKFREAMPKKLYGIAIDIGTTTIAFELIDLLSGKISASNSRINRQREYGADVISRIVSSADKLNELSECIKSDIADGIAELTQGVPHDDICKAVIAANTTMVHLLLKIPCCSLGVSPFVATLTNSCEQSLGSVLDNHPAIWELHGCTTVILPAVSAFVGSDVTSGIMFVNGHRANKNILFVDLGTNGEMAFCTGNGILCTSAAAGPAFEGGNISCGTGSIPGAISKVYYENNAFVCETIAGKLPIGICGSGIMDAVSCLVENEIIDETGLLAEEFFDNGITLSQNVTLIQKDIRELQLAKSAIRSGIEILLDTAGKSLSEVDAVYLAGSFGFNMNIHSAVKIGLIPSELESKIIPVGNSSLGGCVKVLLEKEALSDIEAFSVAAREINLANNIRFQEKFMEHMYF